MGYSVAVNPFENPRRRRKRRRSHRRRRRSYRRRRNPSTLSIVNPRRGGGRGLGGIAGLLMPAGMVAAGQVLGQVLPAKLLKMDATKPKAQRLAASAGVGIVAMMIGARFLGRENAKYLALGALSSAIGSALTNVLPPDWRMSGLGQELVTEEDINEEIRRMAGAGVAAYEVMGEDELPEELEGFGYSEDDVSEVSGLGDDAYSEETIPSTV